MKYESGNVFFRDKIDVNYGYVSSDIDVDISIIGAGISGLVTAYYLSKSKNNIAVFDKNVVGYSNSSCKLGMIDYDIFQISKLKKEDEIRKILSIYEDAKKDFVNICEEIGCKISADVQKIEYTNKYMQKNNMQKKIFENEKHNISCIIKDKLDYINSNLNIVYDSISLTFDPYEFCTCMAKFLSQKPNVKIYENSNIIDIDANYDFVELITHNNFHIKTQKLIISSCSEILDIALIPEIQKVQNYCIVSSKLDSLKIGEKIITNFNDENLKIRIKKDGRLLMSGETIKINPKMLDEDYRKYLEKEKFTKLAVLLNKLINADEYIEIENCFSYTDIESIDNMPIIDEMECMPNTFLNISFGDMEVLSSIIGGKMLKNAVKGLFTKEMRFFRINRSNCY